MEKIMSMTPMHNSEAMSNHVRELTNQANELTTDELEHVSGGGGKLLFEIEDYSFDIEQVLSIGSQSTGAGAGRVK
jgi:bacteriocin-like protein